MQSKRGLICLQRTLLLICIPTVKPPHSLPWVNKHWSWHIDPFHHRLLMLCSSPWQQVASFRIVSARYRSVWCSTWRYLPNGMPSWSAGSRWLQWVIQWGTFQRFNCELCFAHLEMLLSVFLRAWRYTVVKLLSLRTFCNTDLGDRCKL